MTSGDQLKVQIQGRKLVLEKLIKRSRELEETLAWAKKAAQKFRQQLTPQQLLSALKPEFMQRLSEKTQLKIEELGLREAQIEQEILEECYQTRQNEKIKMVPLDDLDRQKKSHQSKPIGKYSIVERAIQGQLDHQRGLCRPKSIGKKTGIIA